MVLNDASTTTQWLTTEKVVSTTPTLGGTHDDREPSLLSRVDEEELDRNLASHQFSDVSLGRNASTISAAEKSFKREDYIYVRLFFFSV
jgi:hypothetical protein